MTTQNKKLLGKILDRKGSVLPIVSLHAIDQPLVSALAEIIIRLSAMLDEVHTNGVEAGCEIGWGKKL